MNSVVLIGNITGDIHYDEAHSFLRLILMAGRPRIITGLRVVLTGSDADKIHACVCRGSEIGVVGYLKTRPYQGKLITEIVANHIVLLRNTHLARNSSFLIGSVKGDIRFEWRKRGSNLPRGASLGFTLHNKDYPDGVAVTIQGALAELASLYLREDAVIAVDGISNKEVKAEIIARHLALLQNIDWAASMEAEEENDIKRNESN